MDALSRELKQVIMIAQGLQNLPFVSYAQNFEDVMLRRALLHVVKGFYIDVGAQSPESDSVTKAFSLLGWRGINIEPHPTYFAQLLKLRPRDINIGVAVGEQSGSLTMNFIDESGLSTADLEIASRHAAAGYAIRTQEVNMLTLAEVWRTHVPDAQQVHFLKVDVEGLERAVLAGNNWESHRPWIVLVEATLPNSQVENHWGWESILLDARYFFVYADGLNRFYVAEEHSELQPAFRYPPNVFDGFITASSNDAHRELGALRGSISALHTEDACVTANFNQALSEYRKRAEHAEHRLLLAHQTELDAQERSDEICGQAAQGAQAAARQCDAALLQRDAALQQRDTVLQSTWWRITAPGRMLFGQLPESLRRQVRRAAKAVWCVLTPWRTPARLRHMHDRAARSDHRIDG